MKPRTGLPAYAISACAGSRRVVVVDLGDRVVMRPLPGDEVEELEGKYRGRGPATDEVRRRARREETAATSRR